ncbi:MAG TPA: hypothetical protein VGF61_25540 [Candidatus Acidoferrum sp.]|jgi:hypothetical protein
MFKKTTFAMVAVILGMSLRCSVAWADAAPSLTLDPSGGALTGAAGATVGWGFTITNNYASDWLVITNSDFCVGPVASPCVNSLGTYADFIASDQFVVVGPSPESPSVTETFNSRLLTGVGSFLINSTALPGDSVSGEIVLTYDLYSQDPNDPNFDPASGVTYGNFLTADASISVPAATVTPEPGCLLQLGTGLLGLAGLALLKRLA